MTRFLPSPEQEAVIRSPLVPLRVSAGAGTGKTATLAHRIVRLVVEEGLEPEEVLGITFTNKAAEELADRIRGALAETVPAGREVEVRTYHGFARHLLDELGALVGVERDAPVITPPFARQLLHEVLAGGDWELLDLTWPGRLVRDLAGLSGALADNLRDPADLLEAAPDDPDQVWRVRAELARVLLGYQERKRRLGAVDYGDLIHLAHRLVDEHPDVAERFRDRFRAVLLDEYQDTNPAQRRLLMRIFGTGFPVTAVGDPAQTIYEWRGASLENFARFPDHFPLRDGAPAPTLPLRTNRRSGRLILELANLVRERITAGGDSLVPREAASPGWVGVRWMRDAVEEARWIAEEVLRRREEGTPWREMAVLFRKTKDMGLVRDALEAAEVPVEVASLGGLLDVPEVVELHAWLRILGDPEDSPALVRILLGSACRLGFADLLPLADWVRANTPWDDEDERIPAHTLLEALDHLEGLEGLGDEAGARLTEFRTVYRELLQDAQGASLVELCRRILDRIGAWSEVEAMPGAARTSARLNLYRFLDLAEEWSPLEGRPSLGAFLDHLRLLRDEEGEELDTARLSGEQAVALLTVHRAKGLEWPVVFLPALYQGNFPSRPVKHEDPNRFPEVLPPELRLDRASLPHLSPDDPQAATEALRAHHEAQEWRVAYVAVTRAAERLSLTGAFWVGGRRPTRPGPLFLLGAGLEGATLLGRAEDPGDRPEMLRLDSSLAGAPDPHFPEGWEGILTRALEDPVWPARRAARASLEEAFTQEEGSLRQMVLDLPDRPEPEPGLEPLRVSVTGLVTYAGCPKRFYWSEVDRLPRRPSASARRGVEFHRRVELHNLGAVPLEEAPEATYDLAPAEGHPQRGRDPFAAFLDSRFADLRPRFVEAPFDLKLGEARIRGRIDAIYEHSDAWEVVDFKSGPASDDPAALVQLQAYALAARRAGLAPDPPEDLLVTFAHFADGPEEASYPVTPEWETRARERLEELLESIRAERFDPIPSDACRHCDFLPFCPAGRAWLG